MGVQLPGPNDPFWQKIIRGQLQLKFLGARIMVGRLTADYSQSPTPATMQKCCNEVQGLYSKLMHLPNIQAEIAELLGRA